MSYEVWKHLKSGGDYEVLHKDAQIEATETPAVVYRSIETGQIWVRPVSEFFDGRFEQQPTPPKAPRGRFDLLQYFRTKP